MVNQTDAQGNKLNYDQIGAWSDGTPRFQATQTLSPAGQQLLSATQGTQQNLANVAKEQSGRIGGLLNAPIDFSAQKDYLNGLTSGALDKSWDRQAEQFETQLTNRGIRPGSTAYQQQMADFSGNRSAAYNAANVNNFTTAQQSQMALRQAPINELLALAGQGQVSSPQFSPTSTAGIAGTDVAGITQNGYNQQMSQYNSNQGVLGGLFSAGASLIPMLSDRRAKTDIIRIGQTDSGVNIYRFKYKHSGQITIGYMAQELLETHPEAVSEGPDGLLRVDYSKVA